MGKSGNLHIFRPLLKERNTKLKSERVEIDEVSLTVKFIDAGRIGGWRWWIKISISVCPEVTVRKTVVTQFLSFIILK